VRLLEGRGHHSRDRIADVADAVERERAARRLFERRAVAARDRSLARQRPEAGSTVVGSGQDGEHARHRRRVRDVEPQDPRMRMGRAQEVGVRHAGRLQIVDKAPAAGHQPLVLDARHRLTDAERAHRGLR